MLSFLPARLRALAATLLLVVFGVQAASLAACTGGQDNSNVKLPAPIESTTLGPGDVFTLQVVGEKELPSEYQIASDGTVDLPYIHSLKVSGLEPQEVARLVRKRLIEEKILNDPSVVVSVKEYNSKRITVLGQVAKPGSFPLTPGLTLIQAISLAGGLTAIANHDRLNLTRQTKSGRTTVVISVDAITDGRSPDLPLQAGDSIYVHERVF
ncbi:MAG: polysaccharide export protein [Polyangiaceae bacterium]|nr:polysaccharide export protein [Polyangiaceae bacterium]MBK8998376.1 polysaccharide export protein [Myxococcales bacterium]MCL4754687.1 polysaccharide export protein [Myxococcales bacterium]